MTTTKQSKVARIIYGIYSIQQKKSRTGITNTSPESLLVDGHFYMASDWLASVLPANSY